MEAVIQGNVLEQPAQGADSAFAGSWRPHSNADAALRDLKSGLERWELWSTLGWHDIRRRYRRSTIGPFWLTLSMGAMIAGIGFLYAGLFDQPVPEYLPYLALGLILWNLISSFLNDGCDCFISSSNVIKQIKAPLSVHVYRSAWRNVLIFAHNILIVPLVFVFFGVWPGAVGLMALPGFALLCLACAAAALILGILSARFRDVPPIIGMLIQFAFFFTPIIWHADLLPNRPAVIALNPFFYMIEVVRAPLLGAMPSWKVWAVMIGLTASLWALAFLFFVRYRGRVAYWT